MRCCSWCISSSSPSRGFYLLAVEAFLGKLLVIAGSAVDVVPLGQEALRADWQPALGALKAILVPHLALVLHTLGS